MRKFNALLIAVVVFGCLAAGCRAKLPAGQSAGAAWYVDNAATGANNGASWADAWRSFGSIAWGNVKPGDTIYISGGASGKTYNETLTVGASGASGSFISIDVGANSPSPSGHSGTVVIDGGGSRNSGIYIYGRSYIRVNGLSGSIYKLQIQNHIGVSIGSVEVWNCSYVYIDYVKVNNATSRGIFVDNADHSRVRGCDVRTGTVNNGAQTDGIYIQYGNDNLVENNTVVLANNGASHNDALQFANDEARLVVRGNWLEHLNGYGNSDSQGIMAAHCVDYCYLYNNVILGSSKQPYQVVLLYSGYATGKWYLWNNTIIAQHPTGHALVTMESNIIGKLGGVFNNNIYTTGGYAFESETGNLSGVGSLIDYNNLYRADGGATTNVSGINAHGISQNPGWNSANEYRLNAGSPCIDKGMDLSTYFITDRDGRTRPIGAAWDIGAYEYGGAVGPTRTPTNTPAAGPTNTPTATRTNSPTVTRTRTPTATAAPTNTPTATRTSTPTATAAPTNTPTATAAPTSTPTATAAPTNTPTATAAPTSTPVDPLAEIRNRAWNERGVAYNPEAAFAVYARAQGLGNPVTNEFDLGGYRAQGFSGGIVYAPVGDWGGIKTLEW